MTEATVLRSYSDRTKSLHLCSLRVQAYDRRCWGQPKTLYRRRLNNEGKQRQGKCSRNKSDFTYSLTFSFLRNGFYTSAAVTTVPVVFCIRVCPPVS